MVCTHVKAFLVLLVCASALRTLVRPPISSNAAIPMLGDSGISSCFLNQYSPLEGTASEASNAFLVEMLEALGIDKNDRDWASFLSELEASLRPTLVALPKNDHGNFGRSAVRYALHRLFMKRYGWSFRGLEPDGEGWNSTSPTLALEGKVAPVVQSSFEARLDSTGLTLGEVTLLAGVLKNMTHVETSNRLMIVYQARGLSTSGSFGVEQVNAILELYMASYILDLDLVTMSMKEVFEEVVHIEYSYPLWKEMKMFMRQKRVTISAGRTRFAFSDVATIVQDIEDNFGQVQNLECQLLKRKLITMQEGESGRVPLSKFYNASITGEQRHFCESTSYLRQLGALDDSDPNNLRVIVPNWINSRSNCVASSTSYSVCCQNECENLLGNLEQSLQAPDGTPSEIAALVTALPSASVPPGRLLKPLLLRRLEQIAESHGGRVRLHGRLFAQWMHHAYPLECAFPHLSGTTVPLRPVDYVAEAEMEYFASEEEMIQFITLGKMNAAKRRHLVDVAESIEDAECTPWLHVEEFFVPWSSEVLAPQHAHSWTSLQLASAMAVFSVIAGMAAVLVGTDYSKVNAAPSATTYFV